jgi:hypothetical protein
MGLTIHYSLKARGSDAQARKLINALHQTAQDLPFKELGNVVELSGDQCNVNRRDEEDPLRWLLIQAQESVEIVSQRQVIGGQAYRSYQRVQPIRLIAFTAWPGEGCEPSNFGLGQFPAVVDTHEGRLKTKLSGWRYSSFCKSQYASNPNCGGVPNFLQCHLTVIALLDKAKELGCLAEVTDEGGFWNQRDLRALVQGIGSWNEMIAAFGGRLKDLLGDGSLGIESEIAQYPNFEQLEAAGQAKLPPAYDKLAALIGRVAQKTPMQKAAA